MTKRVLKKLYKNMELYYWTYMGFNPLDSVNIEYNKVFKNGTTVKWEAIPTRVKYIRKLTINN